MASVSEDTQPATEGAAAASTMTIPGWVRGPLVQPLTLTLEEHEGSGAGRGSSMVGSAGSERSKRSPNFRRRTPISAGTGEIDQQQQEEQEHPGRHSRRNVRGCCCLFYCKNFVGEKVGASYLSCVTSELVAE